MGSLLLGLGVLTMLALLLETTAHQDNPLGTHYPISYTSNPNHDPNSPLYRKIWHNARFYHAEPNYEWTHINWIRVYKNPKTTPATEIQGTTSFQARGFTNRTAALQPSFHGRGWSQEGALWVDFHPDTGELPDPQTGEYLAPADYLQNSALVTDTQNTGALVGDRIAIAVNIDNEDGAGIRADLGIGLTDTMHTGSLSINIAEWIIPPGAAAYPQTRSLTAKTPEQYKIDVNLGSDVGANLDKIQAVIDAWVRSRTIRLPKWRLNPNMQLWHTSLSAGTGTKQPGANHTLIYQFVVTPEHVALNEGEWLKAESYWDPKRDSDAVQPFNTIETGGENNRGFYRLNPVRIQGHLDNDPPTYDATTNPIHYPRLFERVAATPEIDVPAGTQTGTFTVTLRFQEDYNYRGFKNPVVPVPYDMTSEEDIFATLQTALAAGVEHGTVTQVEPLAAAGTYQVTVEPTVLGFVGDMTLQVPADTVKAPDTGLGNLAASVTVPIDTSLQLESVDVVAPESGAYSAGDALTVEMSFAADGLTFEGTNPPYVTIYLGAREPANARHAVWQQGSERSGSTIVPFVYTVHAEDPIVSSVTPDVNSLAIPRETTLRTASGFERVGTDEPAMGPGKVAPVPTAPVVSITDPSGGRPAPEPSDVQVLPVIWIPQEESDPKAAASSVPRTPIIFNELGNGSGDTNDWLELHNVTGSAVSLKDWELSVVADGKKEDTSLIVFADVSVPANGLLLITNMPADKTPLAGGANKGLSHASLVDAGLSLPDDGKFLLILRNAKEKLGLNEAFIDVAGGGGSDTDAFIREQTGDYDTHVWPLQVREAPGGDTENALSSGKVWARAKADIVGYHKEAWAEAVFTGLGYDRKVSDSPEHAGTPGYPNGAVKTEAATPQGAVTFSELMFDTAGGTLPQWIELYNNSKTEALNLNRWKLEIQNRNSEDLIGRPIVTLTLQEKVIQPNQTLLIVAGDARASSADVFPADRVYNLLKLHEKNLRIKKPQDAFLSAEGFYLKLTDRNGTKIDEIGNLDDNRRTDDAPRWVMPVSGMDGVRSSLVRRYTKGVAENGMERAGWAVAAHFKQFKVADLHYGHADDIGTPGYRQGGALPVELSSFTVTRTEAGAVVVTWTTESEVDNAGFNLRRSQQRDSGFTLLNPTLIAGAGTTGEQQTYTFTDTSAKPGVEYYYQIEEVSFDGRPETLVTRRLAGPVSPANRALTTFGEVKKAK